MSLPLSTNPLPIVDLAAFHGGGKEGRDRVAASFDAACRDIGFVLIGGHGVPRRLISRMHEVSSDFFALPLGEKRRQAAPWNQDVGWKGPESSYLADTLTPGADGKMTQDLKESFGIGQPKVPADISPEEAIFFVDNLYPDAPADLSEIYEEYYFEMEKLSGTLFRLFAASLGLDEDYFHPKLDRHTSQLMVNYYPPQSTAPAPGQLRAGAHTDFGALTILHTGADPGGLQVLGKNGAWQDVAPTPDLFVVNLGDLMAKWTNDRWVSTLHRVVNPIPERAHMARQSIVYFTQPNYHATIECLPNCFGPGNPPKYAPVISGEHISMKLAKLRGVPVG